MQFYLSDNWCWKYFTSYVKTWHARICFYKLGLEKSLMRLLSFCISSSYLASIQGQKISLTYFNWKFKNGHICIDIRIPFRSISQVLDFCVVTTRTELSCDEDIPNTYTWKTMNIADILTINFSRQKKQHVFTSVTQT